MKILEDLLIKICKLINLFISTYCKINLYVAHSPKKQYLHAFLLGEIIKANGLLYLINI